MKYVKGTTRTKQEQALIFASLDLWDKYPDRSREAVYDLMRGIGRDPMERRAIYDVMIQRRVPQRVSEKTFVTLQRIYEMRREFINKFPISL